MTEAEIPRPSKTQGVPHSPLDGFFKTSAEELISDGLEIRPTEIVIDAFLRTIELGITGRKGRIDGC